MSEPGNGFSLPDCVARYLAALPLPGRDLTDAVAAEGERCHQIISEHPATSVPAILDEMRDGDFTIKSVCYRLLASLGPPATDALRENLGQTDPLTDIWVAGALRQRGDATGTERLDSLLDDPSNDVRDLVALALALVAVEDGHPASTRVLARLADALASEQVVMGTPFRVADSALACFSRLGAPGLPVSGRIELHNDQHFAFPPPAPPIPLAPTVWSGTRIEVARVQDVVREWIGDQAVSR